MRREVNHFRFPIFDFRLGISLFAVLFLSLLPPRAIAQGKIHLEFESAGPRMGWVSETFPTPPEDAQKWEGKAVDLNVRKATDNALLYIQDLTSGNMAVLPAGRASLIVKDNNFNEIANVQIKVVHDGQPVKFADVSFEQYYAGKRVRAGGLLIGPSNGGVADFYGLNPLPVKVIVKYRVGAKNKTQSESFDLSLKRDDKVPLHVVTITDPVETLANVSNESAPPAKDATYQRAPPKSKPSNPVGDVLVYLLAIFFAALIIFLGFTWLTRNPQKSRDALQKLGVALHDPGTPDGAAMSAAGTTPVVPEPQQQILLQDATPTPLAAAPSVASHISVSPGLVSESGKRFDLAEGTFTLGRDDSADISLPNETSISRKHAEITRAGNSVSVRDLGSTNGTFVNGLKLNGESTLRPGDTVQFGAVRFKFEG